MTLSDASGTEQSLADVAYDALEEMLVSQELLPGSMISETQLSQKLGLGRTPVREALQRLRMEGYIEIHRRRGALVSKIDILRQIELLEVRRPLEATIVRLAALRATEQQREAFRALSDEVLEAGRQRDYRRWRILGRQIHTSIQDACRNSVMKQTVRQVHSLSRLFFLGVYIEKGERLEVVSALHSAVLLAIAAGDAIAAQDSTTRLLDFLEEYSQSVLRRDR